MQGNNLNLHTPLTSGVGFKGHISKLCRCKYIFFIKLSTKTYLTGICYDLNNTELDKMGFMFCDLHVSLNNPSSGDINSSNLPCCPCFSIGNYKAKPILAFLCDDLHISSKPLYLTTSHY